MKALFIGGTGTISTAISKRVLEMGWELWLINRGTRKDILGDMANYIIADINDEEAVSRQIEDMDFDVVCDFIGFVPEQLERDYRLFKGKTKQFMYISSASAYQKPVKDYRITEGTTMCNPYWEYSRNKIACENYLMERYRNDNFPITIVRPSHTYDERSIPVGLHGEKGSWQVIKRMLSGKPVLIHGDGTSLWTMTHNSDFARGFVGLMGNPHAIGEVYQITSDETATWNQIYQIIADALHVTLKPYYVSSAYLDEAGPYDLNGSLIGDKANSVVFVNTKLKEAVPGLAMKVRLEEGILESVEYVLSHPECQIPDPTFDEWCDDVIEALEHTKKMLQKKWK